MDVALPSIRPSARGQFVKIFITLKPQSIFGSNFAYLYILKLFSHWYTKRGRGFVEHPFGRPRSVSENAHSPEPHGHIYHVYMDIRRLVRYLNIVASKTQSYSKINEKKIKAILTVVDNLMRAL